ncbi:MAG: hypothetical protein DRI86_14485 [Bacteroidetes bacterium]|nr:MAG: hypothetical protein DRI86_14485 [Bacteroidota bacterium]
MKLNLVQQLILLSLDNKKGSFISHGPLFNVAIAGAAIAELIVQKKIRLSEKVIKVSNTKSTHDKVLDYFLEKIYKSKKEHSLSHWLFQLYNNSQKSIDIYVQELINNKILYQKEAKILWVFNTTNFPTKDSHEEDKLREKLTNIILKNENTISIEDKILIGLIDVCELNKEVYEENLSKETRKRIKKIIKSDSLSKTIRDEIETTYTTLIVVVTTIIT